VTVNSAFIDGQDNWSESSASSVELFADLSHKTRQCDPATVSVVVVTRGDTKENSRRPRHARKICLPQQQQTRKLPSFSEFDDFSLLVEAKNNIVGDARVNASVGGDDSVNIGVSGYSDGSQDVGFAGHNVGRDTSYKIGGDASVGIDIDGRKQQVQDGSNRILCNDSNIETSSHAADELCGAGHTADELCEVGRWWHSQRYSRGYVSLSASDITSAGVLTTSTPHAQSVLRVSDEIYTDLVECTSQLQLFDASADGQSGTFDASADGQRGTYQLVFNCSLL